MSKYKKTKKNLPKITTTKNHQIYIYIYWKLQTTTNMYTQKQEMTSIKNYKKQTTKHNKYKKNVNGEKTIR